MTNKFQPGFSLEFSVRGTADDSEFAVFIYVDANQGPVLVKVIEGFSTKEEASSMINNTIVPYCNAVHDACLSAGLVEDVGGPFVAELLPDKYVH